MSTLYNLDNLIGQGKITPWLALAFLFSLGSIIGWILEVFYRRFAPDNKEGKWVNPGFCIGPYLPIYGIALCVLYVLATLGEDLGLCNGAVNNILLFIFMALCITVVEYIAGVFCLKLFNIRLWDYRNEFLNFQGMICLKFTCFWWILSAVYFFLIHPTMEENLIWLRKNLEFSFFTGLFYGIFIIDVCKSAKIFSKVQALAKENNIEVKYEEMKEEAQKKVQELYNQNQFFVRSVSDRVLGEVINLKNKFSEVVGKNS